MAVRDIRSHKIAKTFSDMNTLYIGQTWSPLGFLSFFT